MSDAGSSAPEEYAIDSGGRWLTGRRLLVCVLGVLVMLVVGVISAAALVGSGPNGVASMKPSLMKTVATGAPAELTASAAATPTEMRFACALKSTGLMRYVANLNRCKDSERKVTFKPGPVRVCVKADGSVRRGASFSDCPRSATRLTLPPTSGTTYFCADDETGLLRKVGNPSRCTREEFAVFVSPNDAAPSVSSTLPVNGANNIAVDKNITIDFREPVNATDNSVTLECLTGTNEGFSVSGSGTNSITLDPTADLPEGTICTVTVIADQINDVDSFDPPDNMAADYAFSFTTNSAPAVTTTTPADNVDSSANITVNFNEAVDIGISSFTLECPTGNPQTFGVSGSGTSAITLDPDSELPGTTSCTVTAVAANVSDTGDPPDHPNQNASFSFTTKDAALSVASTAPADGAIDVARDTKIDIAFSEAVSATSSAFALECPSATPPKAFTPSGSLGTTITLDPDANLSAGEVCTVTIDKDEISDVDSVDPPDNMAADHTFSFTIKANREPTDVSIDKSNLDENQPPGTTVGTLSTTDTGRRRHLHLQPGCGRR
jgi:methionine-rich copper-binding protein CopC